jgi:molecular chaperone DnaK (HSP70)
MAKAVGIDLGATNSVVAVMEGGKPTVVINSKGGRLTPSDVAYTKNGERMVGQLAKRQSVLNADSVAYRIERQLAELGDRVPVNEKAWAEQLIAEIRQLVKSGSSDTAKLRQLASDLQQIGYGLASTAYEQETSGRAAGAGAVASGGRPGGDDVIDADFKRSG